MSKFLSLILRHKPETVGLSLDAGGWVSVPHLLEACAQHGHPLSLANLLLIVQTSDKQRFALNADQTRIRANQGHSIEVELGYQAQTPPAMLYHGTADRFIDSIKTSGLIKGKRHHVHLTTNRDTARTVGSRHGKPILVSVDAGEMHRDGFAFFVSDNRVWLTEHVPPNYLTFGD
jgi:putative RNA 2'-phosphotransferase